MNWEKLSSAGLEHDLSSEMGLFGGVIAHAHLQHPFGLHPPYVLHVLLLLAHEALPCRTRQSRIYKTNPFMSLMIRRELTEVSRPAERSVLLQDSTHDLLVACRNQRPLNAEPLLVVPHQGAMADLGTCGRHAAI